MMIPNKDPVKIVYMDVSFQGQEGGRLALRSRSMTFFAASGERQGNIAWNAIAKVHTGAVKNSSEEKYMLKILNNAHQSLTFGMKDEQDLDRIRNDIQDFIKAYREATKDATPDPKPAPGTPPSEENSLTCFPRFVNEEVGSVRSATSRNSGLFSASQTASVNQESTRSVTTRNMMQSTRSLASRASNSPSQRGPETFQDEEVYSQTPFGSRSMKGEIVMEEDVDASTIASTVAGSVNNPSGSFRDIDPEAATTYSSYSKRSAVEPTKVFREEDYAMPVASFRLVPTGNESFYQPKEMMVMPERKRKMWHSKWFWLTLLLIALLLLGIGIGMGIFAAKDKNQSDTNQVVGLEDTTIISSEEEGPIEIVGSQAPTPSPSEEEQAVAAAAERTMSPTISSAPSLSPTTSPPTAAPTARSTECDHVAHNERMNTRPKAFDAGRFGGSSYCRANVMALCEWNSWVPFNTYQGVGNAWFKATALEDSFCVADIEHQVQLHVPEGVDYDLHVYHTSTDIPHDSSTVSGSNGNTEAVIISGRDGHLSDQSFLYFIEVEFKGGSSCEPWTLNLYGHQCL